MITPIAFADLPADAITLLVLLLISLAGWVKSKFFTKPEDPLERDDDDPMREIIWRRLVGEEEEPVQETPRPGAQPPPLRRGNVTLNPSPPALPRQPAVAKVEVSEREAELARAFEHSTKHRAGMRTGHRREVDRMLRSPSAAKNAILLTEILGPPVGLKPLDQDKFS